MRQVSCKPKLPDITFGVAVPDLTSDATVREIDCLSSQMTSGAVYTYGAIFRPHLSNTSSMGKFQVWSNNEYLQVSAAD